MTRPLDEPIPDDEHLYRAIGPDHVEDGMVLPSAMDMQGTSVHRAKYCNAHVPLIAARPDLAGIALTTPRALPAPQTLNSTHCEFFVVDDPEKHDHHAEIRIRGDRSSRASKRIKNSGVKAIIAEALARSFTVHVQP